MRPFFLLSLAVVAGCPAPTLDAATCAPFCPPPPADPDAVTLSALEKELIGPLLDAVREGVRPFDERSLGVCVKGENVRKCDDWVGTDALDLPEGEYILFGSFVAPPVGPRDTWKIKLETDCTLTRVAADGAASETSSKFEREWAVQRTEAGSGYTVSPMRRIVSPNPQGAQLCTWRVTALHPENPRVYEGRWSVPGAPAP
jgi:hypothetical protein